MIADDRLMNELTATTKYSPSPQFLQRMKAAGVVAAEKFLDHGAKKIGEEPGIDLSDVLALD
jgi:NTE family protein